MADKPILFSGPMVRAILEGRKTQTRRVIPQPFADEYFDGEIDCTFVPAPASNLSAYFRFGASAVGGGTIRTEVYTPRFAPGDRLWVREHWRTVTSLDSYSPAQMADLAFVAGYERPWAPIRYEADGATDNLESCDPLGRHRQGMHMPRWSSRLTLTVTDVRVQRSQDISKDDAVAEGCPCQTDEELAGMEARGWFRDLWDSLNAKRGFGWDANPWVCAVTFTAHQRNIDQFEARA